MFSKGLPRHACRWPQSNLLNSASTMHLHAVCTQFSGELLKRRRILHRSRTDGIFRNLLVEINASVSYGKSHTKIRNCFAVSVKKDSRREIRNMSRDRLNIPNHNCSRIAKPEGFVSEAQSTSQTIFRKRNRNMSRTYRLSKHNAWRGIFRSLAVLQRRYEGGLRQNLCSHTISW